MRSPSRIVPASRSSPSSNVAAIRRVRTRFAYASRSSSVGPLSHSARRWRSRSAHASISACVTSGTASAARSSIAASADAMTSESVIPTTPGTWSRRLGFVVARVYPCAWKRATNLLVGQVEPGRLQLGISIERMEALVAAESRLSVATEGDGDVRRVERVDVDDARADPPRQPMGAVDVACPHPRGQAVRRVIGDRQPLVLVLELGDGQDGSEDLLARDPHAVGHPVEDRRWDEVAARVLADAVATGDDACAFLAPEVDIAQDLGQLAVVDDRAQAGLRVERLAGGQLPTQRGDPLDELLADRAMDDQPRTRVAGLAAVVEDPPADRRRRGFEVSDVREDELWALPAELERNGLDVGPPHRPKERPAHLGRAGEGDLVDIAVASERVAEDGPRPGHDIEDAVGQAGLRRQLGEAERGQRRLAGGFQHDGVARRKRCAELPGADDHRVVPGHDRADDPDRLTGDQREVVGAGGSDLAVELVDGLGVPLEGRRSTRDVHPQRVADGFADIERLEQGKLVEVLADQIRETEQHLLSRRRRLIAPAPILKGAPSGRDGPVHVNRVALRDLGDERPVASGDVVERPAGRGRHEAPIDEELGAWRDGSGPGDPVLRGGGCLGRHAAYRRMAASSRTMPRPGVEGTRRTPSGPGRIGPASMKSRRSGVQPGGSYGYSMNGPPPTPAATCRLASRPIPFVQVWGVNQRLRTSASSATVRAWDSPVSTTSG